MPIYEFMCNSCGQEFEKIQSFSETAMPICPQCESVEVIRRMSKPAIHFKGSGWYITDSKNVKKENDNTESAASKESSKESNGDSGGESTESSKKDTATESTSKSTPEKATSAESTSSSTSTSTSKA